MNCHYHPDRNAVTQCVACGKNLCTECMLLKENQPCCRDCLGRDRYNVKVHDLLFPALICGVLTGFISAVPVLDYLNCFFCLWIIIGGAAAVYLAKNVNKIKGKITTWKAALTGGITGVVAVIVTWLAVLSQIGDFSSVLREALTRSEYQEIILDANLIILILVFTTALLFTLFGALGGIISNEFIK